MSVHRYAPRVLIPDYIRAGVGLAVSAGPLVLLQPTTAVAVALAALAAVFAVFALRTVVRQFTVVEVTTDAIRARGPAGRSLAWNEIERVRLDYFTTRREGGAGWMQLKLGGGRGQIRIDSTVGEFDRIAAAVAAGARGAQMSQTTLGNFRALGLAAAAGEGRP